VFVPPFTIGALTAADQARNALTAAGASGTLTAAGTSSALTTGTAGLGSLTANDKRAGGAGG